MEKRDRGAPDPHREELKRLEERLEAVTESLETLAAEVEQLRAPRGTGNGSSGNGHTAHLVAGHLEVDLHTFVAKRNGHKVPLTITELKLLAAFMSSPGATLSREQLLNEVWGYEYVGDSRLVDMAVKRLRDKLGNGEGDGHLITTVRGLGYRFEADPVADQ